MVHSYEEKVIKMREDEKGNYTNLLQQWNRSSLESIATLLSGNEQFSSKTLEVKDLFDCLKKDIQLNLHSLIEMQSQNNYEYQLILQGQFIKKGEIQKPCQVLACSQDIFVGGVGETLMIWRRNGLDFTQIQVINQNKSFIGRLSLTKSIIKYENITAIAIMGKYIISGHSDQKLKLYKQYSFWDCLNVYKDHQGGITDLKIFKDNLISTSQDCTIKIWVLQKDDLQCLQTLKQHTNSVNFITLCQEQNLMVTSSSENYFNFFQYKKEWEFPKKYATEGKINRVHFCKQLICQQVNPPKLLIYQVLGNSLQMCQQINLNISDNSISSLSIMQFQDQIFCKNANEMLVIRKSSQGKYSIDQIISGSFSCGVVNEKCLFLGDNEKLEIYEQY